VNISIVEGDITALEVDAIANAANNHLWMGSGVAEVGDVVATSAGTLPARWVIHGAVMGQDLQTNADLVRRTTESCLRVADELGAESLALPAFGTGVGGFPLEECARIMVEAAGSHEPKSLRRVVFAVFGADAKAAFERTLSAQE
jgi:O-acetyl-ADP-ribose deacetylase